MIQGVLRFHAFNGDEINLGRSYAINGEYLQGLCPYHAQEITKKNGKHQKRRCQLWLRFAPRFHDTEKMMAIWLLYGYLRYGQEPFENLDPEVECQHRGDGVAWRHDLYQVWGVKNT